MILSNFKTFTKKVCNGNEQTAYRYLDEIERGAMAIGEYGRESFGYIIKTGRYFNAYTDEYYVFDLVKPAKWELVDENGEKVGEIPDKIIYKLYGGIDFCHDDFGNDESTDNNIVNEIMESVYGETIKK